MTNLIGKTVHILDSALYKLYGPGVVNRQWSDHIEVAFIENKEELNFEMHLGHYTLSNHGDRIIFEN